MRRLSPTSGEGEFDEAGTKPESAVRPLGRDMRKASEKSVSSELDDAEPTSVL